MVKQISEHTTHLLWTGGWDSTYRLLELVIEKRAYVQPYYIIDTNRRSLRNELIAMRKIKDKLFQDYPYTKELVFPTFIMEEGDIAIDQTVIEAFTIIAADNTIGNQYLWLHSFCENQALDDLELGIVIMPNSGLSDVLEPYIEIVNDITGKSYRVNKKYHDKPGGVIFRHFSFPLYKLFKHDMFEKAQGKGWLPIMKLTWFCHTPVFGFLPCGICTPCSDAFQEKMDWRFPFYLRILDKIKILFILRKLRKQIIRAKSQ